MLFLKSEKVKKNVERIVYTDNMDGNPLGCKDIPLWFEFVIINIFYFCN